MRQLSDGRFFLLVMLATLVVGAALVVFALLLPAQPHAPVTASTPTCETFGTCPEPARESATLTPEEYTILRVTGVLP